MESGNSIFRPVAALREAADGWWRCLFHQKLFSAPQVKWVYTNDVLVPGCPECVKTARAAGQIKTAKRLVQVVQCEACVADAKERCVQCHGDYCAAHMSAIKGRCYFCEYGRDY